MSLRRNPDVILCHKVSVCLLQTGITNSADAVQLAELLPQRWGTFMHKG